MFDPWADPYGNGWQLIQGFYAFGSGGLLGVGVGFSRQKYAYLPMAHNDFIFAVIGEECGLLGTLGLLAGFMVFLWAGLEIARRAPDLAGRLVAAGCTMIVQGALTESEGQLFGAYSAVWGALVSALVGADLYVICSDVDGLYTANPQEDPTATLIERVEEVDHRLSEMAGGAGTSFGTGGMSSKLRAARAMLAAGIPTVICRGRRPSVLIDVASGERIGTRFESPVGTPHEGGRKLWIGLAEVPKGTITLDEGATRAVLERGASILPVGIVASMGSYEAGDVVNVRASSGDVIGRGVARYSSDDMTRVRGIKLDVIGRFLGQDRAQPAVHRDDLLVF